MCRDLRPKIGAFLRDGTSDGRALHFTLRIDDDACVVLEVDDDTVLSAPALTLTDDDARDDLLAEIGVTLLDGGHGDVTDGGGRKTIETATVAPGSDQVEILGTSVVRAVDNGTDGQGKGDLELVTANRDLFTTHNVIFFSLLKKKK